MTKEYTMDPPDNFERTIEENEIAEEFGLDDSQLWWRRMKIGEEGSLSLDKSTHLQLKKLL